jgi:hypothetical protein
MADHDRNPVTIIGRDADAKSASNDDRQTTAENTEGTSSDETCEDLDIVFEFESNEDTRH